MVNNLFSGSESQEKALKGILAAGATSMEIVYIHRSTITWRKLLGARIIDQRCARPTNDVCSLC